MENPTSLPATSLKGHNGPLNGAETAHGEDPICIIGIGCRLPADIRCTSTLWDFLIGQKSAQQPVPPERFNINGFYKAGKNHDGTMNTGGGYFLGDDVRQFDNNFFGINNLEAAYLDPQQRKLLEVVYECIENSGISMEKMSGSNTGVFVGSFTIDHKISQLRDIDYMNRYTGTGTGATIMANRISYIFNLKGPSVVLDTACSSSLYALHAAVAAIKAGDCDAAIVAAANLITSPEQHYMTFKGGVLSPTSACHTFDVSADGYGRAEGVNAIFLERVSSAMHGRHKIRAVIRGTATNSNGKTNGITQPDAIQQEIVIRKAYANAGLDPAETDYVECHGTGTAVGDPVEIDAISRVFSARRSCKSPLMIGSVKTSIGHSEAASGLSSIIKVILAFEHDEIPPTYGIKQLNPKLNLDTTPMKVVTDAMRWPRSTRRAGVNSFGYGGANAHAILESTESYLGSYPYTCANDFVGKRQNQLYILPVSAASEGSLETRLGQIRRMAAQSNPSTLQRLAFTLTRHRSQFRCRSFLLAEGGGQGASLLLPAWEIDGYPTKQLPIAFVFPGQGAQYAGMARELLLNNSTFAKTIRSLDFILQCLPPQLAPEWTLEQTIQEPAETSQINHVTRSQPLTTAIQIGLINVLRCWGVHPEAVIGHSSGEIAAAHAAGLLDSKQALLAAYLRGYAVGTSQLQGSMMAVGLSHEACEEIILAQGLCGQVDIACINAPESVTLSGSTKGIQLLLAHLNDRRIFSRVLHTGGQSYHSYMMREVGDFYEELLNQHGQQNYNRANACIPKAKLFSSVAQHGEHCPEITEATDFAKYWRDNLEKPVQFSSAIQALIANGEYQVIEIGPHSALKSPIDQIRTFKKLPKSSLPYLPTMIRNKDANLCLQTLAGTLSLQGRTLDWGEINASPKAALAPLQSIPPYPWDYSGGLAWYESRPSYEIRDRKHVRHELLGSQQVAGNGVDWNWRNIVQLTEAAWLQDHKIDNQVVFPGTAYLAMAVEALTQIRGSVPAVAQISHFIEFKNVNIKSALVLPDSEEGAQIVEIHTTMSPRKISTSSTSMHWYDFTISSWRRNQPSIHCAGSVRFRENVETLENISVDNSGGFAHLPIDRWYKTLGEKGVQFGSQFRSLTSLQVNTSGSRTEAIASTSSNALTSELACSDYILNPIAMDACLQASIATVPDGPLKTLKPYLPVYISECRILLGAQQPSNGELKIHAKSLQSGVSFRKADSTLYGMDGEAILDFRGVRLALYGAADLQPPIEENTSMKRHPCLRIQWKPDISRLSGSNEAQFRHYLTSYASELTRKDPDLAQHEGMGPIAALVDLAGHKNPRMKVLELGEACDYKRTYLQRLLDQNTDYPRCSAWYTGKSMDQASLSIEDDGNAPFDLVLLPSQSFAQERWENITEEVVSKVSKTGIVIIHGGDAASDILAKYAFKVLDAGENVFIALRGGAERLPVKEQDILLISREITPVVTQIVDALVVYFKDNFGIAQVSTALISEMGSSKIDSNTICICMVELEREYFATMTQKEMEWLRHLTNVSKYILWLTGADILGKSDPNLTLSGGFFRSLVLEQPSLHFSILDVGQADTIENRLQTVCEGVWSTLALRGIDDDNEYVLHKELLFIARFEPDNATNSIFRQRFVAEGEFIQMTPLLQASPARLCARKPGTTDSLYFQQLSEPKADLPAGFVDVEVKAVGLNAKDVYAMNGRIETWEGTTSTEFAGIVIAVVEGDGHEFHPGDRVLVTEATHFSTVERVPARLIQKLLPHEEFSTMASLPVAYTTALYALQDRAHLRAGESVLVHSGAGALGTAVIRLAKHMGAVVFTTVSSQAKREFVERELGVPGAHIFNSRDDSFAAKLKHANGGRGVDVLINSLTGDLMHTSWACMANFGRFVEVGKRELIDAGRLDMHKFLQSATFTAFDLYDLCSHEDQFYRDIFTSKVKAVLELYRAGHIHPVPVTTFDAGSVAQAYRYFSSSERIGKVVISFENTNALIPSSLPMFNTVFDQKKCYLLVGCLGGLGRSLSRWMVARGARHLIFMSRSGADKPQAQELIAYLRSKGASVALVRGDVTRCEDVEHAVMRCEASGFPIGGVVQGAMGLHEAIFSEMTNEMWHVGMQPKWAGTWNLHYGLDGHDADLDFFLLMSSLSGSFGIATESNYCASNGFLDAFAHWRRTQSKPAVSVGLGMIAEVGYLHENPEIEAILLRRGLQPLSEHEFLQIIDLALAEKGKQGDCCATGPGAAHILTGLELLNALKFMEQGFKVNHTAMGDARASRLAAALEAGQKARSDILDCRDQTHQHLVNNIPWLNELSTAVASLFQTDSHSDSLNEAVLVLIRKQFSNLILLPLDKVDSSKPLAEFGVDSMIASEFRTWFWTVLKVDVPFLDLLSRNKCLQDLADLASITLRDL